MKEESVKRVKSFFDLKHLYLTDNNLTGNVTNLLDSNSFGSFNFSCSNSEYSKQALNRGVFVGGRE